MVEKGEIKKKDELIAWPGVAKDVSDKNNTHTPGISIHSFPEDVAVWPKWLRGRLL